MVRRLDGLARDWLAASNGKLRDYLRAELVRAGLRGEAAARMAATTRMRVRTGRLRNSITSWVDGSGTSISLHLQAGGGRKPLAYAGYQEEGGTVRPRRGRYLAIPLPEAQTAAGALRARFAVPGGLRNVPGLFLIRSGAGNLLLVERRGKDGIRPLFVLKTSTSTRGKFYLRSGLLAAEKGLPDLFRRELVRVTS